MGRFLDAAFQILRQSGEAMGPREIVQRALTEGILWTKGATPAQTMKSKIATDILVLGEKSQFMRHSKGKFALRGDSKTLREYHAARFIKKPLVEAILVIPTTEFFQFIPGPGLHRGSKRLQQILRRAQNMDRMEAEVSDSYIQLISFFLVKRRAKILTYKRTGRLPEKSLKGVYSVGFGGHMTQDDIDPLFVPVNPLFAILPAVRELNEELSLKNYSLPKFRGLMYDNSNPTSKIHVGLVFEVELESDDFEVAERGNFNDVKFESISAARKRINDFESWSRVLIGK